MPEEALCWSCHSPKDAPDNYCRRCGMGQGACLPWYYHPLWIVVLALFAMGPLVLPLIWRTPKLSKEGKWAGTGLVVLLTWWLVVSFLNLVHQVRTILSGAF